MDEHLSGVSMRRDGRSSPTAEYSQTARRTAEYRLVEASGRRDGGVQATGQPIGEGYCRRWQSNEGRERRICDQIVGFACSLADRAVLFPLFSRPESPSAPRGTGDGLGSPDVLRSKSEGKRGTRGATGPFFAVQIKKTATGGLAGLVARDALTCVRRRKGYFDSGETVRLCDTCGSVGASCVASLQRCPRPRFPQQGTHAWWDRNMASLGWKVHEFTRLSFNYVSIYFRCA
jgi:hypothetical protein